MASHASMSNAYDAFLFESLGTEENGMDLSVLSALARAGVDPWAEARKLAALPRQAAIAAIAAILNLGGDGETARRLAELLPRTATSTQVLTTKKFVDRQAMFRKYGLAVIVAWLVVAVAFMMLNGPSNAGAPAPASASAVSTR
jgi:CHASE3 domain sensor protein